MKAGPIDIISKGIQRSIIKVGLAKGWNGATTPARAVSAINNPTIRRVINRIGLHAIFPNFKR
tara:strand:+ start:331 stop:519 length:189 start_codon:yes stop_codon:yes gene_type:complete